MGFARHFDEGSFEQGIGKVYARASRLFGLPFRLFSWSEFEQPFAMLQYFVRFIVSLIYGLPA